METNANGRERENSFSNNECRFLKELFTNDQSVFFSSLTNRIFIRKERKKTVIYEIDDMQLKMTFSNGIVTLFLLMMFSKNQSL